MGRLGLHPSFTPSSLFLILVLIPPVLPNSSSSVLPRLLTLGGGTLTICSIMFSN